MPHTAIPHTVYYTVYLTAIMLYTTLCYSTLRYHALRYHTLRYHTLQCKTLNSDSNVCDIVYHRTTRGPSSVRAIPSQPHCNQSYSASVSPRVCVKAHLACELRLETCIGLRAVKSLVRSCTTRVSPSTPIRIFTWLHRCRSGDAVPSISGTP